MTARSSGKRSLVLVFLIVGATPTLVKAQGNTFNPYGNSGYADYREFSTPMYSNNPALPGQSRLNGESLITKPRANSYRQYLEEEEGTSESSRKGGSINNPNSRAYRPNDTPQNREYAEHLRKREEAFSNALKEKDPVKRSKLLRQIENDSAYRMSATSKTKTAETGKAPAPNGLAKGATTSKAPSLKGEKRSTAPPPPLGSNARRTRTSSPPPPVPGSSSSRTRSSSPSSASSTTTKPPTGPPDPSTIAPPPR